MQINRAERLIIFACWSIGFLQRPRGDKFITLHQSQVLFSDSKIKMVKCSLDIWKGYIGPSFYGP